MRTFADGGRAFACVFLGNEEVSVSEQRYVKKYYVDAADGTKEAERRKKKENLD